MTLLYVIPRDTLHSRNTDSDSPTHDKGSCLPGVRMDIAKTITAKNAFFISIPPITKPFSLFSFFSSMSYLRMRLPNHVPQENTPKKLRSMGISPPHVQGFAKNTLLTSSTLTPMRQLSWSWQVIRLRFHSLDISFPCATWKSNSCSSPSITQICVTSAVSITS